MSDRDNPLKKKNRYLQANIVKTIRDTKDLRLYDNLRYSSKRHIFSSLNNPQFSKDQKSSSQSSISTTKLCLSLQKLLSPSNNGQRQIISRSGLSAVQFHIVPDSPDLPLPPTSYLLRGRDPGGFPARDPPFSIINRVLG